MRDGFWERPDMGCYMREGRPADEQVRVQRWCRAAAPAAASNAAASDALLGCAVVPHGCLTPWRSNGVRGKLREAALCGICPTPVTRSGLVCQRMTSLA